MIEKVQMSDAGTYYCGIDVQGTDWYETVKIVVKTPAPTANAVVKPIYEPATDTEKAWMGGYGGDGEKGVSKPVKSAMSQGQGNKACTPLTCEASRMNESGIALPPLRIVRTQGDVCVCHPTRKNVTTTTTGWSDCRLKIETSDKSPYNCTAMIKGVRRYFQCPFDSPSDSSPAAVWVCGDRAFHSLPTNGWSGCCYPALMNVGTSIYLPGDDENTGGRHKRSVSVLPGNMPNSYNGYVLFDLWTSIGANIGLSLFYGGGTAVTINKINGLAWSVLAIANSTESALTLISDEMKQIRDAVIQSRMALDILTAEKVGLCRLVGVSCCFSLPDYSSNITDIVAHMRMAVKEPKKANNSWLDWLSFKWGTWIYWAFTVVLPVVGVGLVLLCCLPCIFRFISWSVGRLITSTTSLQMVKMAVNKEGMNIDMGDEFDYDFW